MKKLFLLVVALVLATGTTRADVAPAPPLWSRISTTDVILVGRANAIEDKDVEAVLPYGDQKIKYRIAVVTVTDGIKDAKDLKTVRIGFIPQPPGAPQLSRKPFALASGDEGLFYLTKHPKENFYLVLGWYDFVSSKSGDFAKNQTAEVKRLVGLRDNGEVGLLSKDRDVRFLSAALLVSKYRQRPRFSTAKAATQPIDAAQSKLILAAIHDADWTKMEQPIGQPAPAMLFNMLGLTPATYRIQRFVTEK
jgi:hypothetical protein